MKVSLEINAQSNCLLGAKNLQKVASQTILASGVSLHLKKVNLSVAFVSSREIKRLNRIYRKKNQITDILSFAEYSSAKKLSQEKKKSVFLGELIICCSYIKKSAKIDGIYPRQEFNNVFSHGILHLLGFNHEKKMFGIQDKIIQKNK